MITHNFCRAKIFHCRNFPKKNSFLYEVFYLLIDIRNLDGLKSRFLSIDKFNIFSFYKKDHAKHDYKDDKSKIDLEKWIKDILKTEDIEAHKIMLLCHPRLLGYVFNPVSFWFCFNEKDELIATLAEVQNTFGEAHSYLIYNQNKSPINKDQEHFAQKEFHVSPFFKREGKYRFKFDYSHKKIMVFIDYFNEEKLMLNTSLIANLEPLNDKTLIRSFFVIPFLTFKVIILIHYQALKIVFKGIKYIKKPVQFLNKITKNYK